MDKETLSNYGWIVICVLVLAVMIALATPFGSYISTAVKSTTQGLFDTNKNALNSTGLINIGDQSFSDGTGTGGSDNKQTSTVQYNGNDFTLSSFKGEAWTNVIARNNAVFGTDSNGYVTVLSADKLGTLAATSGTATPRYLLKASNKVSTNDKVEANAVYTVGEEASSGGDTSSTVRNGKIPAGATYTIKATNTLISEGNFPSTLGTGDVYTEGDYIYTYNKGLTKESIDEYNYGTEWSVKAQSTTKTEYGTILTEIAGKPITNMVKAFSGCYQFAVAPKIPDKVTDMSYAFSGCRALTTAPTIPNSVTNMYGTFQGCKSLTTAPVIPNGVTNMGNTFQGCSSLTTAPVIPNGVTEMYATFFGCTSLITAPEIPDSVTKMDNTFYNCTSLTTAPTIPDSVTHISSAFRYCTSLTVAPAIPEKTIHISGAFYGCTSLTGTIEINSNPINYNDCLKDTQITSITGLTNMKTEIFATK